MRLLGEAEVVDDFTAFGVHAFTTSRLAGTFGLHSRESVSAVMARWRELRDGLSRQGTRLATAHQVHGNRVVVHNGGWGGDGTGEHGGVSGWLRVDDADGHVAAQRGIVLAVTVADCVPIFIAHPSGAVALLHSGWRGTADRILEKGINALEHHGFAPSELRVHLGPAICGKCYEVSPEVHERVTGLQVKAAAPVDLRAVIATHARSAGIRQITLSPLCTKCDNQRFFSHRMGDEGRQIGVIVAAAT